MSKVRRVDLVTLSDVIAEIESLRQRGYARGGNWNLSQICQHIHETVRVGLDGTMKPLPWILRATMGNLVFLMFRKRWSRGISGLPTLPTLVPAEQGEDDPQLIDQCLATLSEARDRTEPLPPYPLTTSATLEQWRGMMATHAQHHLEFLQPNA